MAALCSIAGEMLVTFYLRVTQVLRALQLEAWIEVANPLPYTHANVAMVRPVAIMTYQQIAVPVKD